MRSLHHTRAAEETEVHSGGKCAPTCTTLVGSAGYATKPVTRMSKDHNTRDSAQAGLRLIRAASADLRPLQQYTDPVELAEILNSRRLARAFISYLGSVSENLRLNAQVLERGGIGTPTQRFALEEAMVLASVAIDGVQSAVMGPDGEEVQLDMGTLLLKTRHVATSIRTIGTMLDSLDPER